MPQKKASTAPKNEEQNQPEANEEERRSEAIYHSGSVTTEGGRHKIHCLTIIGQIEGHYILPPQNKTTKYEHVIRSWSPSRRTRASGGCWIHLEYRRRRCGGRPGHCRAAKRI